MAKRSGRCADTGVRPAARSSTYGNSHRDTRAEHLFAVGRARALLRADGRERLVEIGMAIASSSSRGDGAVRLLAALAGRRPLLILVVAYVIACRAKFEIADGYTVPTELVLVPMLFLLPTPVVPLVVSLSWALGRLIDYASGTPTSPAPSTSSATAGTRSARRWC